MAEKKPSAAGKSVVTKSLAEWQAEAGGAAGGRRCPVCYAPMPATGCFVCRSRGASRGDPEVELLRRAAAMNR
jgi:hypothetical protein